MATLAPHECVGCGVEGRLICVRCLAGLEAIPERCYRCRRLSGNAITCPACRTNSPLHRVQISSVYRGIAKEALWLLKSAGAQALAGSMAMHMIARCQLQEGVLIVPVPTATGRVRQRGYDQAELLAREVARQSRRQYVACLARLNQAHQVGAGRDQRLRQLTTAFRASRPDRIRGAHIVLVDDVVTTGSTLEAAATSLKSAGAKRVDALVFAQP